MCKVKREWEAWEAYFLHEMNVIRGDTFDRELWSRSLGNQQVFSGGEEVQTSPRGVPVGFLG